MRIDASGRPGIASLATEATHGADVSLNIAFDESSRKIIADIEVRTKIEGAARWTESEGVPGIKEIAVISNGGAGEDGEWGQDGAPGVNGADGANATEGSNAGGGGNGGRGGDGTSGTSGGPGGNGGNVTVSVAEEDLDTLALLRVASRGGPGGAPGRHGRGGSGGRGGNGGSGISWTEYYQEGGEQKTRYHSRGSGSSGSNGPNGYTPTTPLYPGDDGRRGDICVAVTTDNRVERYNGIYDLRLVDFKATPRAQNGIYEPGDTIEVSDIQLRNDGPMATPRGKRLSISLPTIGAMEKNEQEIFLIDSIPPGGEVTILGRLIFTLKEHVVEDNKPLPRYEVVDLQARAVRVDHVLRRFTKPKGIKLSHPIEIENVHYAKVLLPGEFTKMTFDVKNFSLKEMGATASDKALQRAIKVTCETQSVTSRGGKLVFCDADGATLPESHRVFDISKIDANNVASVSCYVKIENAQDDYTAHRVVSKLFLGRLGKESELKWAQAATTEIREGIPYTPSANNDFLLVTNASTTAEELRAWSDVAQQLGLTFSIWDTSVYQHLHLGERTLAGAAPALLETWRDKLFVVLNQEGAVSGIPCSPLGLISQGDLDQAIRMNGVKFYSFGSPKDWARRPSLMDQVPLKDIVYHEDIGELKKAFSATSPTADKLHSVRIARVAVNGLSRASKDRFDAEVEHVRAYLKRTYPTKSFSIEPTFNPSVTGSRFLGQVKLERLGEIEIRLQEGTQESVMLGALVDEAHCHNPNFVKSNTNKVALLASLPAKQLVKLVVDALTLGDGAPDVFELLATSLVYKITKEAGFDLAGAESHPYQGLPTLGLFKQEFISRTSAGHRPIETLCASVISKLELLRERQQSWYQRILPFGKKSTVLREFDAHLKEIDRHVQTIGDGAQRAEYQRLVGLSKTSLRASLGNKAVVQALCASIQQEGEPVIPIAAYDLYVSGPNVDAKFYENSYREIEAAVSQAIESRAAVVKSL